MRVLVPEAESIELAGPLAHYREHGYARIGRVIAEDFLAALRARADELMLGQVAIPGLFFQHDSDTGRYEELAFGQGWVGPSLHYRKLEKLERDGLFRAHLENALFERLAKAVIGNEVSIYRSTLFNKAGCAEPEKGGGTVLPWHQDGGS